MNFDGHRRKFGKGRGKIKEWIAYNLVTHFMLLTCHIELRGLSSTYSHH